MNTTSLHILLQQYRPFVWSLSFVYQDWGQGMMKFISYNTCSVFSSENEDIDTGDIEMICSHPSSQFGQIEINYPDYFLSVEFVLGQNER